jgi:hypothetical protein
MDVPEGKEELRQGLLNFWEASFAYDLSKWDRLYRAGPPGEPPQKSDKGGDDEKLRLTLDIQNLFTANTYDRPGGGHGAFFSNDISMNFVFKNANLKKWNPGGSKSHELTLGHEPQVGPGASLQLHNPADAAAGFKGAARWHNQLSAQVDVINYSIKLHGDDFLEIKGTAGAQLDVTAHAGQLQLSPNVEWHASEHVSVVGQVQWSLDTSTWKGQPPTYSVGLLVHTF